MFDQWLWVTAEQTGEGGNIWVKSRKCGPLIFQPALAMVVVVLPDRNRLVKLKANCCKHDQTTGLCVQHNWFLSLLWFTLHPKISHANFRSVNMWLLKSLQHYLSSTKIMLEFSVKGVTCVDYMIVFNQMFFFINIFIFVTFTAYLNVLNPAKT